MTRTNYLAVLLLLAFAAMVGYEVGHAAGEQAKRDAERVYEMIRAAEIRIKAAELQSWLNVAEAQLYCKIKEEHGNDKH